MLDSATAPLRATLGHRWRLVVLWFVEACVAFGAFWALATGGSPTTVVSAVGYLLLCGVVFVLPAQALRLALLRAGAPPHRRRRLLELMLAGSAAAIAASLGSAHGWIGVVCILLVGNVLWALEFELRGEGVSA